MSSRRAVTIPGRRAQNSGTERSSSAAPLTPVRQARCHDRQEPLLHRAAHEHHRLALAAPRVSELALHRIALHGRDGEVPVVKDVAEGVLRRVAGEVDEEAQRAGAQQAREGEGGAAAGERRRRRRRALRTVTPRMSARAKPPSFRP